MFNKARKNAKTKNKTTKTAVAFVSTLAECDPNAAVPRPPSNPLIVSNNCFFVDK